MGGGAGGYPNHNPPEAALTRLMDINLCFLLYALLKPERLFARLLGVCLFVEIFETWYNQTNLIVEEYKCVKFYQASTIKI